MLSPSISQGDVLLPPRIASLSVMQKTGCHRWWAHNLVLVHGA